MTAQGKERSKFAVEKAGGEHGQQTAAKKTSPVRKGSVYKQQLLEKQKVKKFYGVSEEQFRRFFANASRGTTGGAGENLLCLLERRVDNVVYRLKLAASRKQARQMVVHGHVRLNGKKIQTPSLLVKEGDKISFANRSVQKEEFVKATIEKRLNIGIKVPEWLELRKEEKLGIVSRLPKRPDVHVQVEEHLIVELYSK
jgi:small subunit ribosomal protein S4